jgi:hypothetical protein
MENILANRKVAAAGVGFEGESRRELAAIFVRAFDDGGNRFPIDFEEVWRFLSYSNKANALRKLKQTFFEGEDYTFKKGTAFNPDEGRLNARGCTPDLYMMTQSAFESFAMSAPGERGKLVRRYFLAIKEQYFGQLEGLGKRKRERNDMLEDSVRFLAKEHEILAQELTARSEGVEKAVQRELCRLEGGAMEVACDHGVVDLLTDDEVIEVKEAHLWKHALGQILAYKACFPKHAARIHLFTNDQGASLDLDAVCEVCSNSGVRVTLST